jgi:hypothetical protein
MSTIASREDARLVEISIASRASSAPARVGGISTGSESGVKMLKLPKSLMLRIVLLGMACANLDEDRQVTIRQQGAVFLIQKPNYAGWTLNGRSLDDEWMMGCYDGECER